MHLRSRRFFAVPSSASAATLQFAPANTSVSVERVGNRDVFVSSPSQALNAVSGALSFPADLLQVVSVSTSGSLLTLWVQNPTFSNSAGTISFSGIVPDPGYTGSSGQVVSIKFRAKAAGAATVAFSSASQVLADDGNGTDILATTNSGTITVAAGTPVPSLPQTGSASAVSGESLVVTSPTHPDPTKWYDATAAELDWTNPADATAVRIGYDKYQDGKPSVVYSSPVISQKSLTLGEGVWYFHAQAENADGWGPIDTFRIQIDTTPPNPIHIQFPDGSTSNDPQPLVIFNTTDDLSGIAYYVVTVSGSSPVQIPAAHITGSPYPLSVTGPGQGSFAVTAYDEAGNSVSSQANFDVVGLNPPKVDSIADLAPGQALEVSGTTYPNAQVEIFLKNENGQSSSQTAQSDSSGSFETIWKESLDTGLYTVTAQTTDATGAKSTYSAEINFEITRSLFAVIGQWSLSYLSIGFLGLCVLISLAFFLRYAWHQYSYLPQAVEREIGAYAYAPASAI